MTIPEEAEQMCRKIEGDFENDAVLLFWEYAPDIRLLSVGINHPLWDSCPIENIILPEHSSRKNLMGILNDDLRKDIDGMNKIIRKSYS